MVTVTSPGVVTVYNSPSQLRTVGAGQYVTKESTTLVMVTTAPPGAGGAGAPGAGAAPGPAPPGGDMGGAATGPGPGKPTRGRPPVPMTPVIAMTFPAPAPGRPPASGPGWGCPISPVGPASATAYVYI